MFRFFLTWWGALLLGALDTSIVFFLPFGIDAVVIYLSARNEAVFWVYPLLAVAGSMIGAAGTFWIGRRLGEAGLERLVSPKRLARLRDRVNDKGAIAMAVPALFPPPFPLTPFILTCGALAVDRRTFFITFGVVRVLRFGLEALLAVRYGRGIVRALESQPFQLVVIAFIVIAIVGTTVSGVVLWRGTRRRGQEA